MTDWFVKPVTRWQVTKRGEARPRATVDTEDEAGRIARALAVETGGGVLLTLNQSGKVKAEVTVTSTPNDDPPCSGSGYAHKPHGRCKGYTYDRT